MMSLKEFESFLPLDDNYHNHEFYADLKSLVIIYQKGKEPVVFASKKRYDEEMKRISKLPATKKQKALIKAYAVAYYEDTPFKPSLDFIDKITMKQATDFIERLFKFFYHLSSNPNPIPKPFYDGGMIIEQFKQRAIELENAAEELAKDAFLKEKSGYRFNKDEATLKPPYEHGTAIDYIEAESKRNYSSYEGSFVFMTAVRIYLRISKEGIDGTD